MSPTPAGHSSSTPDFHEGALFVFVVAADLPELEVDNFRAVVWDKRRERLPNAIEKSFD